MQLFLTFASLLLDFIVYLDGGRSPVPTKEEAVEKFAIIVHYPDCYTIAEERRLKGFHKLRRRHLEIEGYRVLEIDPLIWNKLSSVGFGAEIEYLWDLIFSTSDPQLDEATVAKH